MTKTSSCPLNRDTVSSCWRSRSNTAPPGSGKKSGFQPVFSFQKVDQTWLSKPMTKTSSCPGNRDTTDRCCFWWSNTAPPGSGKKSAFQPLFWFQKVVQTRLSKPMTNTSSCPGNRDTTASFWCSRSKTAAPGRGKKSAFQPEFSFQNVV